MNNIQITELVNYIIDCMEKQGGPSVSSKGNCMYRGPNNTKCAIGHLIGDHLYRESFEGTTISTHITTPFTITIKNEIKEAIQQSFPYYQFDGRDWNLLGEIQRLHDRCSGDRVNFDRFFTRALKQKLKRLLDENNS